MASRNGKSQHAAMQTRNSPKKRDRHDDERAHHYCGCNWHDCKDLHKDMAALDPIFAGFVTIPNTTSHRGGQLHQGAVRHIRPPTRDGKVLELARHHLHLDLLKKHDGTGGRSKRQLATPISQEEAEKVGIFEWIDRYQPSEEEIKHGHTNTRFVQVPNITRKAVGDMIKNKQTAPSRAIFSAAVASIVIVGSSESDSESSSDLEDDDTDGDDESDTGSGSSSELASQIREMANKLAAAWWM